jgi:serine/threonine protein kinase
MIMADKPIMNNYSIIRSLGFNASGGRVTYLVEKNDHRFVLKQFQFAKGADWGGFKELEREVAILRELEHPQIPRYVESFETDSGFCLVQEYIDSPSLGQVRSHTLGEIKAIALQCLEILVYLQSLCPAVLHRDIKPDNLLWDGETIHLVDFGFSRVGNQGVAMSSIVVGTMGFMPPELMIGREPTNASDLYSLGATLLSLVTGTPSTKMAGLMGEDFGFADWVFDSIGDRVFLGWLRKMVSVRVSDRFANAADALSSLKPTPRKIEVLSHEVGVKQNRLEIVHGDWYSYGRFYDKTEKNIKETTFQYVVFDGKHRVLGEAGDLYASPVDGSFSGKGEAINSGRWDCVPRMDVDNEIRFTAENLIKEKLQDHVFSPVKDSKLSLQKLDASSVFKAFAHILLMGIMFMGGLKFWARFAEFAFEVKTPFTQTK